MSEIASKDYTVLVVEDDNAMREFITESLTDEGYAVLAAAGGREGVKQVRAHQVDLVVTDLRMPDMDGLDMVRELRTLHAPPDVITVTAFGTIDTAIKAMKLGAFDYITKPFEIEQLLISIERALRDRDLHQELSRLREAVADKYAFAKMIGHSPAIQEVFDLVRRLADSPVSVLVAGESGTGKELVARALHFNGNRSDGPFVPVNCAAIPANLLESELFGYKKGAFTDASQDRKGLLEEANGGTIFFDEVGELPLQLQAKLLRVLQEREVKPLGAPRSQPIDVRVISATNCDLQGMIEGETFRKDLFYRLNVVEIHIPPLRERGEDILPLATHLLEKATERANKPLGGISPEAARLLLGFNWPGNVRELENVMERAVALSRGSRIEAVDLPPALLERPSEDLVKAAATRQMTIAELEQSYILRVLAEEQGNKTRTAQRLGLDRKTLYRKLEEYRRDKDEG
ncbi:MAG: sigma-54-dependent Fis family transcriptional regulator [Deltaproteobacteria bacterium]|nr:sigma-54-dependent Fis family transcriptional regulator [Deltaproteobacteria bacterium]